MRSSKFNLKSKNLKSSHDFHSRLKVIKLIALIWFLLLAFRLFNLQIAKPDKWISWARKQHQDQIQLAGFRGKILDRFGKTLAVSVPAASVYIRPKQIKDQQAVVQLLSETLSINQTEIKQKFESSSPFVWVKRQVPRYLTKKIDEQNLAGVGVLSESRRYYPFSGIASTLVGKVGIDGNGLSGLEARYEKKLSSPKKNFIVFKDALGNQIRKNEIQSESIAQNIQLTIDAEIQQICNQEITKALETHLAKRAVAVLIDANSGELLALSQVPTVNFNFAKISSKQDLMNYAIEAAYEPGSTLKPIVATLVLNKKLATVDQVFNTENGSFRIGKNTVNDVHPHKKLNFSDIVVHSSNIGMTKLALLLGKEELYQGLKNFGFGSRSNLVFPGEAPGILRNYKNWAEIDLATHSFGQGVAVTALQLVRAFSVLVNGGYLTDLKIIANDEVVKKTRLISEETSTLIRETLVQVVESDGGTGKRAKVKGLIIGGKTGTAQKARTDGRGYQKGAYLASFIGFADGTDVGIDRQLVLLVMLDEPSAGSIYGGTVSAPAFSSIMQRTFYLMALRQNL